MVVEDLTFELEFDPGWRAIAEPVDEGTNQALRRMFTDAAPERVTVQVAANESTDVSGHAALSGATIDVVLTIGADVDGHAFSLRFPSPADAQRMRTRLAAGGLLIAALTVGSISVADQLAAPHTGSGAAVQAAPVAAPAPLTVSPALKADLRYPDRDSEVIVPQSNTSSDVPTIPKE